MTAVATQNTDITQAAMRVWKPTRIARPPSNSTRPEDTASALGAGEVVRAEIGGGAGNVHQLAETGENEDDREEDAADEEDDGAVHFGLLGGTTNEPTHYAGTASMRTAKSPNAAFAD